MLFSKYILSPMLLAKKEKLHAFEETTSKCVLVFYF